MTEQTLNALLSRIYRHQYKATDPVAARYWRQHWFRLYNLAKKVGWFD